MQVVTVSPAAGMQFLRNIYSSTYRVAWSNINGTSMYEMLRLLDQIDRDELYDFQDLSDAMKYQVAVDRINFACDVVENRKVPADIPAVCKPDLPVARGFLGARSPLRIPSDPTNELPAPVSGTAKLTLADFEQAADTLGIDTAVVQAVSDVEAGGSSGFAADGRPIIRFELHVFREKTRSAYDKTHPHLSAGYAAGLNGHNGGQANEWSLIYGAMMLGSGADTAFQSASWGMFQIMGSNFDAAGYPTATDFALDMCASSGLQLQAFVNYCQSRNLAGFLNARDWAGFARRYNGPAYASNAYDTRLAAAYRRHGGR